MGDGRMAPRRHRSPPESGTDGGAVGELSVASGGREGGRVQDIPRNPSLPRENLCFPSLRNAQTPFSKKEKKKCVSFASAAGFPHLPTQRYSLSDIDGEERANLQAGSSRAPSIAMAREQEQSPMQRRLRSVFAHLCVTKLIW
jgi:hypothetical protein